MFPTLASLVLLIAALGGCESKSCSSLPSFHSRIDDPHLGIYCIPHSVQNGTSHARFNIQTTRASLSAETLLSLDGPQVDRINASVFDWWYFDVVSDTDPRESLVVTFFTSSAAAFPFLAANESSILIAYLWASFANGTVVADFVPATAATVAVGNPSSGQWSSTGFSWAAHKANFSQYEINIASEKMQVNGKFRLSSVSVPTRLLGQLLTATSLSRFTFPVGCNQNTHHSRSLHILDGSASFPTQWVRLIWRSVVRP